MRLDVRAGFGTTSGCVVSDKLSQPLSVGFLVSSKGQRMLVSSLGRLESQGMRCL